MGFLSSIGSIYGNIFKGLGSMLGYDSSGFENDEAQKFQAEQSQLNRDFQERMLQKQMDYTTDMWNKTNEYNSAESQMQRYREAGLNPYLMMTNGASAGTATSQDSPSVSGGSSPSGGFANTHPTPAGQFISNLVKMKTERSMQRQMDADSSLKEIEANTKMEQLLADLERTRLGNKNQSIINSMQFELLDATHKQILQQSNTLRAQEKLNLMDVAYKAIETQNLPVRFKSEIAEIASRINLNKANAKEVLSREILNQANEAKVKLDTKTAERMADDIVRSALYNADKSWYDAYHKVGSPSEFISRLRSEK